MVFSNPDVTYEERGSLLYSLALVEHVTRPQFDTLAGDFAMQESRHDLGLGCPGASSSRIWHGDRRDRDEGVTRSHCPTSQSTSTDVAGTRISGEALRSRRWSSGSR